MRLVNTGACWVPYEIRMPWKGFSLLKLELKCLLLTRSRPRPSSIPNARRNMSGRAA
ncbi:hypothetical protein CHELA40_13943 [Chelatococcus asaccharovorans]|nr:hypothetical protein CHELA40_13943 [Chelatococcus asaccharovorans]CAH1674556.1 hypothetical protein CHELA17_61685 [Chelatococcus asaccharovorans]